MRRIRSTRLRQAGRTLIRENVPGTDGNDTNYIFLHFVLTYLPAGLVGLIFACIFSASLSSSSGELSALATTSIVDIYRRFFRKDRSEAHYLKASRIFMVLWGIYGIGFAQYASALGSLIEAVNILGSLFYGTMLGIFLLAFYAKRVDGRGTFWGALAGEAVVRGVFPLDRHRMALVQRHRLRGCCGGGVPLARASRIQISEFRYPISELMKRGISLLPQKYPSFVQSCLIPSDSSFTS